MSTRPSPQAQEYLRAAVLSATPMRLVVLLYDGAIRHLRAAIVKLEASDDAGRRASLARAHEIVAELMNCLDPASAPDLARDLERHYAHVLRRITEANALRRRESIDDAVRILEVLRRAWIELEQKQSA